MCYDIRNALYDRLQRLSFAFHDGAQTGQLMSRATVDVEAVRLFFGMGLLSLAQTFLLFGGITYLLVSMDWKLALLSLVFLPAIGWRAVTFSRRLQPIWMKIQQLLGFMGTTLEESLTGIRIVKAFTRQQKESQKFSTQATKLKAGDRWKPDCRSSDPVYLISGYADNASPPPWLYNRLAFPHHIGWATYFGGT
jgi:ATP-binding cassette subfamily B protein